MLLKKIFSLLILQFAFLIICAQQIKRLDGTTIPTDALTKKINQLMTQANVQGLAISVFNSNKVIYKKTFGYKRFDTKTPLTINTNIYGASLSKAVFSVLVMKLVDERIINLDKPLQGYLPKPVYEYGAGKSWNQDYTDLKQDSLYKRITARMCLSHTSGFPNWRWDEKDEKLRVLFIPGAHYSYSGEGLCYLQFVIEKLTGKSLELLAATKIFKPLRMKATAYTWRPEFEKNYAFGHGTDNKMFPKDKDNAARSASTLETTLDDYTLFLESVLQKSLLKPASYNELFSTQIRVHSKVQMGPKSWEDTTSENDAIKLGYGLGWGVLHSRYGVGAFKEGHGNGFQHYSIVFPAKGIGILIMTNSDNGENIFMELLKIAIADTFTPWKWERYMPVKE